MKRYFYFLAAAFAAASCSVAEIQDAQTPDSQIEGNFVITAAAPNSKAIHGTGDENGTSFKWEAGKDAISSVLFSSSDGYSYDKGPYILKNTVTSEVARFVGDIDSYYKPAVGDTLCAMYPSSCADYRRIMDKNYREHSCFRTMFGSTMQIGNNNTDHLDQLDIMVSRPLVLDETMIQDERVNTDIVFAHVFSKLRFTVQNSTSAPFTVNSLVYHSNRVEDQLSRTIYMDAKTHEIVEPSYEEYGDCPYNNNAVLQVSGVTLQPGESAVLWTWLPPYDFTASNADGRTANIYVNTTAGTFHVDNVNFDAAFEPGKTYRHKFTATDAKKMVGYTLVPDRSFASALYSSAMFMSLYDFNLNKIAFDESMGEWEVQEFFKNEYPSGVFLKNSEVAEIDSLGVYPRNALSLEGLQAFTGLRVLNLEAATDMSSSLAPHSIDLSALTNLEKINLGGCQAKYLDLSKNTKLKHIELNNFPLIEQIDGLAGNTSLLSFDISGRWDEPTDGYNGVKLDFSGCSSLKTVYVNNCWSELNISNLDLECLSFYSAISGDAYANGLKMDNLKTRQLYVYDGRKLPSIPQNVRTLVVYVNGGGCEDGVNKQLGEFTHLDTLGFGSGEGVGAIAFGPANSSVKVMALSASCPIEGLEYLSSVKVCEFEVTAQTFNLDLSAWASCDSLSFRAGRGAIVNRLSLPKSKALSLLMLDFDEESAEPKSIYINDLPALKNLYYQTNTGCTEQKNVGLGNLPALESISFTSDRNTPTNTQLWFNTDGVNDLSYPALKSINICGKFQSRFPLFGDEVYNNQYGQASADSWVAYTRKTLPAVEELIFNDSREYSNTGMGFYDLRPYDNLKMFYTFWRYGLNGSYLGKESIWITKAQEAYINENKGDFSVSYYIRTNYGTAKVCVTDGYNNSTQTGGYAKVFE